VLDPLSELSLGLLFAYSYGRMGLSLELGCFLVGLSLLLLLVRYDLAHQILPPAPLAYLVVTGGIFSILNATSVEEWRATAGVAVALTLVLATIYFVSRGRALGFSDIPLVFGLGLLFPGIAFSGFIFSFWIGALIGIVILARRPKGSRIGVEVPFAPFLASGFVLAYITQWDPFTIIAAIL
jgi:leader peptidase (prepilin peptidase)/N-methyltransferase